MGNNLETPVQAIQKQASAAVALRNSETTNAVAAEVVEHNPGSLQQKHAVPAARPASAPYPNTPDSQVRPHRSGSHPAALVV